jgi:predicted ATPase
VFHRRSQRPSPTPDDPSPGTSARGNLPAELSSFVGREAEPADLGRLLRESRLVTVVGVGGVRKTRCATRVAALLEKRYCNGVWLVELSTVHDPELLEHAVVDALGLTDHTGRSPRTTLLEHLAERQLLLALDGFEHLVDTCA